MAHASMPQSCILYQGTRCACVISAANVQALLFDCALQIEAFLSVPGSFGRNRFPDAQPE